MYLEPEVHAAEAGLTHVVKDDLDLLSRFLLLPKC